MIAPEYFNNHIAVEGEIVVKRVPNDTGSVVVWNSVTNKLSIRTHAEIVSDLKILTTHTEQNVEGTKWFRTAGGSAYLNHRLRIISEDGSNPGMVFYKSGANAGTLQYDGSHYIFTNSDTDGYGLVLSDGYKKSGSNDSHVLLGGGGHKAVSDFASSADLPNLVTKNTEQTITADKVFKKITTTDWVIPRFLAFPDASGALPNYIGFYMWNSQWQVNWRDPSNNHMYQLLDIDGLSKNATFYGNTTSPKLTTPGGNSDQWNEAYHSIGNYVTINTDQGITGKKIFYNQGQNFGELPLVVWGNNGSKGGIGFVKGGTDSAILNFDTEFHFTNNNNDGYKFINAAGVKAAGSDDNHVLLGGGGHKSLDELVTTNTSQDVIGTKSYINSSGNSSLYDNKLHVKGNNGSKAGISFWSDDVGQLTYWNTGFHFKNQFDTAYQFAKASAFIKDGFDDNYFLLAGGGHKELSSLIPYTGAIKNPDFNGKSLTNINRLFTNGSIKHNNLGLTLANNAAGGYFSSVLIKTGLTSGNMGTFTVKLYRYAHDYYEFNINNYKYNNSNYGTNVTWKAGNSEDITRIEFLKDSNNTLYVNVVIGLGYPRIAITDFMAYSWDDEPFDAQNWSAEFDGSISGLINEGQATPSDFKRDNYLPGHNHTHQSLFSPDTLDVDANSLFHESEFKFNQRIHTGSSNMFPMVNNANSILSISTHPGGYGGQLGFNGDYKIYFRGLGAGNWSNWRELAYTDWVSANFAASSELGNYWKKYDIAGIYNGIKSDRPFAFLTEGDTQQKILTGGVLVSDIYADNQYIPNNGIYSKGDISTGGIFYGKKFTSLLLSGGQVFNAENADTLYMGNPSVAAFYLESDNNNLFHNRAGHGVGVIWDQHNLNPVTLDTNQTIIGSKIFAQTSNVAFYGNEYNDVEVWKSSANAGIGGVVSGHVLTWYNSRWKVGNARSGDVASDGYAFWFSDDQGSNYTQKVIIGTNSNIQTNQYGNSAQWKQAYDWGNHADANYVKKSGDTMTGALTINIPNGTVAGNGWHLDLVASNLGNTNFSFLVPQSNRGQIFVGNDYNWGSVDIQPLGGDATLRGESIATQPWVNSNFIPKTHPSYGITQIELNNWRTYDGYWDNRLIQPADIPVSHLQFGFTSWNNDGGVTSHWADFLHFGGYQDASGGNQNLISFNKSGFGLRQWQGTSQSPATYQSFVDYWHSGHFNQANVDSWNNMVSDYVTLNTFQNINGRKSFGGAIGNAYNETSLETRGGGSANPAVYPSLSFHQGGLYAGTLQYRGDSYYFYNINGSLEYIKSQGYIKDGSSNQMLLLGDGSHEDKNKYVFGSNNTGTVEGYSPDKGLPVNSFKPTKSGFYRPNGENEYGSLLMWAEHPQTGNGSYGAGMAFDYAGTNAYLTGIDGAGNKTPNKKLWHSGDFTQAYVTEWINATNAGILTHGSAVQVDGAGGINQGSNSRSNKVWFDYNWAGSGRAGSVINFSGLNPAYNVELFAAYHGDSNAIGIRTRNGDSGVWSLPRWLWNSENFNPDNKVNKSGDTMTGTLSFANNTGGVMGTMGDDDYYRIVGRTNGYDNGYLEIATADGGTEPIHVRQYAGVFTNLVRTATLLDENGNTSFPGTVYSQGFMKTNSDNSMLLLGGGGHKPIADFATVFQLGNFVSKSGDAMAGPLVISTNNDALTVTTSGSVLNAKLYNSSSDSIIRMQSTNNPFWDIRAEADGRFLLENNSVTRLSMDSSANINFSGTSLKFNGHNIWDANNLNPVTLDTPQTIIQEKTFNRGIGLTTGQKINLAGYGDSAHYIKRFDDDSDGFGISTGFVIRPYNNENQNLFYVNFNGAYIQNNIVYHAGNFNPDLKHSVDLGYNINNGSDTRTNRSWFDYNWAESGQAGSVINFSGLESHYSTELFGSYNNPDHIAIRTKNGDNNTWNRAKWLWHSDNFNGKIGARNLVPNSSSLIMDGNDYGNSDNSNQGYVIITGGTGPWNCYAFHNLVTGFSKVGKTITAQIEVMHDNPTDLTITAGFYIDYVNTLVNPSKVIPPNTWVKLSGMAKNVTADGSQLIGLNGSGANTGTKIYYRNYQLEESQIPSSYRPAYEDPNPIHPKKIETVYALNGEDAASFNNFDQLHGKTQIGSIADTTWWHAINIQHRNGLGDGDYYAGQIRFGMTSDLDTMQFRQRYNGGWQSWKTIWNSGNFNPAQYVLQSNLNAQLSGYATLNSVQTFTNTNTFTSSPVIPNGTLGTHAVNKNQIELSAGNEGENGQQLTISGNNSVHLTNFFLTSRDGSRNPDDIAPDSTSKRVRFDFAYANAAGLGGSGNYAGIMTYSPWLGTSASTGDSSYQLAFANQTGVDGAGIPMLKIRKGINGSWTSLWYKFWTEADFSSTNIQQWNHIAQFGLQLNQSFSNTTGYNLMISDDYFGNESGLVDAGSESFVAGRVNEYYKYGSRIKDGFEGINYHLERKTIGIGGEADENKLSVRGCVKATANFKSEEERADTIFIPNGNLASLRDEIVNDESEYAIRLDPHHYEIDSSGNLEVNDRNRLIHIIGEEIKMSVNFKEIYPKQQIVIYNFDQKDYPMTVLVQGKPVYSVKPGAFLRLYVTKSLRVIAESQLPCEFIW